MQLEQRGIDDPSGALPFAEPPEVAFCTLWTTGPDPALDRALRLSCLRRRAGAWQELTLMLAQGEGPLPARVVREFGLRAEDFEGALLGSLAFERLLEFIGDSRVVTTDGSLLERWCASRTGGLVPRSTIGLLEIENLTNPSRAARLERRISEPSELLRELALRASEVLESPDRLRILALGTTRAIEGLRGFDPEAADRLALILGLLEHPSHWSQGSGDLFEGLAGKDGRLSRALRDAELLPDPCSALRPAWYDNAEELEDEEPLPPSSPEAKPFSETELNEISDLFAVHLPAQIAADQGLKPGDCRRESQREVADQVARSFGSGELLLVHAPTGTGKTLAYLIPALLWARSRKVRIGLSTYTRALQEQAMTREVPQALGALARAGHGRDFRVAVLKGRENYLCFRGLQELTPDEGAEPERWLAWMTLVLFALADPTGDLDTLSRRPPVTLAEPASWRRAMARLIDDSRARSGCCQGEKAARLCAGSTALRRAERSQLVIVNHARLLARPEFLTTVVFDECEHLHDSAASAWEHRFLFPHLLALFAHLLGGDRQREGFLARITRRLIPTTSGHEAAKACAKIARRGRDLLNQLEAEAQAYLHWRAEESSRRGRREAHTLFSEYLLHEPNRLAEVRGEISAVLNSLDSQCAALCLLLVAEAGRDLRRVRRGLEVLRQELTPLIDSLNGWLPIKDDSPHLDPSWWHEIETDQGGRPILVAIPLAPQELLGREYLPELESAALLSATTFIGGSFDAARRYLGITLPERPDQPSMEPRQVQCFAAPEVFDYGRVQVGIPLDAPSVQEKGRYLAWLTEFVAFVAERARGRTLVLLTSLADCKTVGEALTERLRGTSLPHYYQGMPHYDKEELADLFRDRTDSILLGVDTFWYGADFPGETLEYLILARLPYGVPDDFHQAQCALMGEDDQRRTIYMPRALAKFRQGAGRLMRKASDRGVIFLLDRRVAEPKGQVFLRELPVRLGKRSEGAEVVAESVNTVLARAFAHMNLLPDLARRGQGLEFPLAGATPVRPIPSLAAGPRRPKNVRPPEAPVVQDTIHPEELPY